MKNKTGTTFLNATLLDYMVSVGAVSCLLGILYSQFLMRDMLSTAVHVIGFVLLICLRINKKRLSAQTAGGIIFIYFGFIYTPFEWLFAGGLLSNVTYVVFMFCCLMIVVLDGKLKNSMLGVYLSLIAALIIENIAVANIMGKNQTEVYEKAIVFSVVLAAMIFLLTAIKQEIENTKGLMEAAALTDELSKAYNGRFLKEKLVQLENSFQKSGVNYGAAILDVDDFKKINDTYGHLYGDEVIRHIAVCIQKTVDENTLLCRYGGDEFIILFVNQGKEEIYPVCEEVRRKIKETGISDQNIHVTISMGVCERKELAAGDDMLKKIDELLYESKKSGKNKVSFKKAG